MFNGQSFLMFLLGSGGAFFLSVFLPGCVGRVNPRSDRRFWMVWAAVVTGLWLVTVLVQVAGFEPVAAFLWFGSVLFAVTLAVVSVVHRLRVKRVARRFVRAGI